MRYARYFISVLFLMAVSFAYADSPKEVKRVVAAVDPDGVQRVEDRGGEYFFDRNEIVVKVNAPVELKVMKKKGYVPHNIAAQSPEAGIEFKVDLGDKEAKTVKFTHTKTGKYPLFCDKRLLWFKSHKDRGMEGVIEVVE